MRNKARLWSAVTGLLFAAGIALAGSGTITIKDGAGSNQVYAVTVDGSGNFLSRVVLCDQAAGANCATVSGNALAVSNPTTGFSSAVTLTRTNDANAYTAGDVVGASVGATAAINFTNIGPSGGEVTLTSASLEIDIAAVPSGMTTFRLYLYNVTPPSAFVDNAAWTGITAADRASFLGYVDLGTPVAVGTSAATLYVQSDNINKQIKLAGTGLFAYLVTNGGYTPVGLTTHPITLHFMALN